ncbi:hypothetical protein [Cupriavidus sp. TMH.W2]|uniref:hypothetical protein n=1 Tax=Cupriavidus sp. TMH.W2 TaxID=3434465 RepID=UPI003D78707A
MAYYTAEIDFLTRFLTKRDFRAEISPGSVPGESATIIQVHDGKVIDPVDAPEDIAAAAQLLSLLLDLEDGIITKPEFDNFGGPRCRDLVKKSDHSAGSESPRDLMQALANKLAGARFRVSQKGTPLVVVGNRSICWFGTRRLYRVFDDYGNFQANLKQTRRDFKSEADVLGFFEAQGVFVSR